MNKIKKFLSIVLVVTMAISSFSVGVSAADCDHEWNDGICKNCGDFEAAALNNNGTPDDTSDDYYEIGNAGNLYWFSQKVNSGETTISAKLMANIDATSKADFGIGTAEYYYGGTFDGNGYELKLAIDTAAEYAAPFSQVSGATIKNLTVMGTITTSAKYAGGIIGGALGGEITLEKCLSLVTINSTVDGDGTHGGLVGDVESAEETGTTVYVKNCGFAGAINGEKTNCCGGFAGWLNDKMIVSNSFVAATYTASAESSNTIARNDTHLTLTNVYYLNEFGGIPAGATAVTSEQMASGELAFKLGTAWKQTIGTDAYPNFSGKTVYGGDFNCAGIPTSFNNTAADGKIPAHDYGVNGICSVCGAYQPAVLSDGYYEIDNVGQFLWFVDERNVNGKSLNAKLVNDIDLSGIDYTPVYAAYCATFDGNGYTISNMTINTKKVKYGGNMVYGYLGLFSGLGDNGIVKDLTLTGTITCTEEMTRIGGVAGYINGYGAEISNVNCYVNITSASVTGKQIQYVGGIVGRVASTGNHPVTNCHYYGNINLDSAQCVGGIAGNIYGAGSKLDSCENYGTIYVNSGKNVGGVVGYAGTTSVIEGCLNGGVVTTNACSYVGGIAGYLTGETKATDSANYGNLKVSSGSYVGGVAGCVTKKSTVESCLNEGEVTANSCNYVGGIAGCLTEEGTKATGCVNRAVVTADGGSHVGGVIGSMWNYATVESCLNAGKVTLYGYDCVGGVVGYANQGNIIKNCANVGAITGSSLDSENPVPYVGGVLGYVNHTDFGGITGCYSIGRLTATENTYCGAIVGWGRNGATSDKIKGTNYYLNGKKAVGTTTDTAVTATSVTSSQVSSGELCYLLNGGVTDGTQGWYQELTDTAGLGEYPNITGKTVYKYTDCKGSENYVNRALSSGEHKYRPDGLCAVCGQECTHTFNSEGFCTVCGGYEPAVLSNGYYEIDNAGKLYWFASKVNSGNTKINGKLTADITVNPGKFNGGIYIAKNGEAVRAWTPIGNDANDYEGTFDGNGKTVSGLYFNDDYAYYVGLFGAVQRGTVRSVGVVNSYLRGYSHVGGIAGYINIDVIIENCFNSGTVMGLNSIGGIVGNAVVSYTVSDCYNTGSISAYERSVGGIVGKMSTVSDDGFFENCYNAGTVRSGNGSDVGFVGAVAGMINDSDGVYHLKNCYYLKGCAVNENGIVQAGVGVKAKNSVSTDIVGTTAEKTLLEFSSGEVCYLLNNSKPTGVWKQNLGAKGDKTPKLTGDTVNYDDSNGTYYNTHNWSHGVCTGCGAEHSGHTFENGVCTVCGGYEPAVLSNGYYEIDNVGQFLWFVNERNVNGKSLNAKLVNDIDLSGVDYTPISAPYCGTFDGNNHTISGMTIDTKQIVYNDSLTYGYYGLFGGLGDGAVVKDLTIKGTVTCTEEMKYVGGLAGYIVGNVKISNVDSYVNIISASTTGKTVARVGGIVGNANNDDTAVSVVENCRYYGKINLDSANCVGGIVGYLGGSGNKVTGCENHGSVYVGGGYHTGGIVGALWNKAAVDKCMNTGSVEMHSHDCLGGIVGYANNSGLISNCGNTGSVTGVSTNTNAPGCVCRRYSRICKHEWFYRH